MNKAFLVVLVLFAAAPMSVKAGRSNRVRHYYDADTFKESLMSAGACRHHLSAHPGDLVAITEPPFWSPNPDDCN